MCCQSLPACIHPAIGGDGEGVCSPTGHQRDIAAPQARHNGGRQDVRRATHTQAAVPTGGAATATATSFPDGAHFSECAAAWQLLLALSPGQRCIETVGAFCLC